MAYLNPSSALWSEISELAIDEELKLYELQKKGSGSLDVVIDKLKSSEKAMVGIEDCTRFSKRLRLTLASVGEEFGLSDDLEIMVSSPGVNRSLRLPCHFDSALGQRVKISWTDNEDKTNISLGILKDFSENLISVVDEKSKKLSSIEFSSIKSANVEFKF